MQKEAPKEQNFFQQLFLDSIPIPIFCKDNQGHYIGFNKAFESFFGQTKEKLLGKSVFDICPIELAKIYHAKDQELFDNKTTQIYESQIEDVNGVLYDAIFHKATLFDEKNNIIGLIGAILDITEQNKLIQKLKEQKQEFKTMFTNSKDGIAILDLESNFLEFNEAYLNMTGFTREELLKKSCIELTIPHEIEQSTKVIEEVIRNGFVKNFEKSCVVKDLKVIVINMTLSLMPDKQRIMISTKEITSLKILEEQTKLAAMGEMIGNIAHQWRQPLSVISTASTGMLVQKEYGVLTDEEFKQACYLINNNVQYLSKTIDDFTDFIKGDRQKVSFNLTYDITHLLSLVNGSMKTHSINVIINTDDTINIVGYPNELIQSLINIINNAKDILVEKEVKDKFIFITTSTQNEKVIIKIKDNAGGIPENILNKIFEPYFTTKHKSQGTGLGLHMTYNLIVDGMNGIIEAKNVRFKYNKKEYTGAEFSITLPLS